MLRLVAITGALAAAGVLIVGGSTAAGERAAKPSKPFPPVIQLPTGFQPEGIAVGKGTSFYAGAVPSGALSRGNLRTGSGSILVPGGAGRPATGIELDSHNRLIVAGAGSGNAYVYDAKTGALVTTYNFATAPTFV